ncbi:MAG TPA: helix-turn-helix transcriptional regulator [Flavobacterium sp.]|jgi:transcriptional regulator with XRE-family HTH domain
MRKKTNAIRESFGFTQEEMAGLFGISRSYLALCETGKRNLPVGTSRLVDKLAMHLLPPNSAPKEFILESSDREVLQRDLERILKENEYKQRMLAVKIQNAEKKYAGLQKRLEIMDHLNAENADFGIPDKTFINYIALKCSDKVKKEIVSTLFHCRLKLLELQQSNALCRSELKKLSESGAHSRDTNSHI